MAMEHANSFVERIFENDEFVRTIIKKKGFSNPRETNEDMENEKIVKVANDMGFKFDVDEFKLACRSYMSSMDGWESVQKVFHVLKVAANSYRAHEL